jgi:hypothetical protein
VSLQTHGSLLNLMNGKVSYASGAGANGVLFQDVVLSSEFLLGFDETLEQRFPARLWASEKVLRFKAREAGQSCDELVIRNRGQVPTNYLRVFARDLLLIMDAKPGDELTAPVSSYPVGQSPQVQADGRLSNGTELPLAMKVVPVSSGDERVRYTVGVAANGLELSVERLPRNYVVDCRN